MAVQAQHPSKVLLPKSHSNANDEPPAPANISTVYNCSGDIGSSTVHVKNTTLNPESMSTKPSREEEDKDMKMLLIKQMRLSAPLHSDAGLGVPGHSIPCSRLPFSVDQANATNVLPLSNKVNEDTLTARLMQIPTSSSSRALLPSTTESIVWCEGSVSLSKLLANEVQMLYLQQRNELDRLFRLQVERPRIAMEEKRQCYTKALLPLMEDVMRIRLNEKDAELERAARRYTHLQERLQQLHVESQVWQNIARNNEALALSLVINLEQLAARCKNQQEGSGESEVDDTAACVHGGINTAGMAGDIIKDRSCRVCKMSPVCVLLLPCRHVCLCKCCDLRLEQCPICGSVKNSSLEVYTE